MTHHKFAPVLKFIVTFLVVFSVSTSGIVAANIWNGAAASPPNISVGNATGSRGSQVSVPVTISDNPGVVCVSISISYDNTALDLIAAKATSSVFPGNSFSSLPIKDVSDDGIVLNNLPNKQIPYIMTWEDGLNPDNTQNGTLANLTFNIKDSASAGEYPITLQVREAYDFAMTDKEIVGFGGKITIGGNVPSAPSVSDITLNYFNETIHAPAGQIFEFAQTQNAASWTTFGETGLNIQNIIGKTVYVRKAAVNGVSASNSIQFAIPSRPASPSSLTLESVTDSSITLKTIPGAEYKIDGGNWTENTTFSGLTKNIEYTFESRYKANATSFKSDSVIRKFTAGVQPLTGSVVISGTFEYNAALTANTSNLPTGAGELSYKWYRGNALIAGQQTNIYFPNEADIDKQLSVEVSAKNGNYTGFIKSNPVLIEKATPTFPTAKTLVQGQNLSAAKWKTAGTGIGTFKFKVSESTVPPLGTTNYVVVFTPADTNLYKAAEQNVSVTVIASSNNNGGGNTGGTGNNSGDSDTIPTETIPVYTPNSGGNSSAPRTNPDSSGSTGNVASVPGHVLNLY